MLYMKSGKFILLSSYISIFILSCILFFKHMEKLFLYLLIFFSQFKINLICNLFIEFAPVGC